MPPITSMTTILERVATSSPTIAAIMTTNEWPQPQLSTGPRIGSLGVLNRVKCWRVLARSPADNVWNQVSTPIRSLLEAQSEHFEAKDQELMIDMFMIGRDPQSCQPTILFSCRSKHYRQTAMHLVHTNGILKPHPGVRMADYARLPVPLGMDELDDFDAERFASSTWSGSTKDITRLMQLTQRLYRECQRAGEDYVKVRHDLRNLYELFQRLQDAVRESSTLFDGISASKASEDTFINCRRVLGDLDVNLLRRNAAPRRSLGANIIQFSREQGNMSGGVKAELRVIQKALEDCTFTINSAIEEAMHQVAAIVKSKSDRSVHANGPMLQSGISVEVIPNQSTSLRRATMGGVLRIYDDFYGLTVKHTFTPSVVTELCDDSDDEFAFFNLNEPSQYSDDENDLVQLTSQGSISSTSSQSKSSKDVTRSIRKSSAPSEMPSDAEFRSIAGNLSVPLRIGALLMDAPAYSLLDWALIDLDLKTDSYGSNLFPTPPSSPQHRRHDAGDGRFLPLDVIQNVVDWNGSRVFPKGIAPEAKDAQVYIKTGNTERVLNGRLSGVPSFRMLLDKGVSQELWTVTCVDGNFSEGDCGSWVVDCESKLLYGHLVSGYPDSQTAYLVPALKIFDEIAEHFGEATISNPEYGKLPSMEASDQGVRGRSGSIQEESGTEDGTARTRSPISENAFVGMVENIVLNQPWSSVNFLRFLRAT